VPLGSAFADLKQLDVGFVDVVHFVWSWLNDFNRLDEAEKSRINYLLCAEHSYSADRSFREFLGQRFEDID